MSKEFRKKIEAELAGKIKEVLSAHHQDTAAEITRQIKEGVKLIAKKFAKRMNEFREAEASAVKKSKTTRKRAVKAVRKEKGNIRKTGKKVKKKIVASRRKITAK